MKVIAIASGILLSVASGAMAQAPSPADTKGEWTRGDGNARVKIVPCGDAMCATNIWVKDTSRGEAVGDVLVMSVKPKGDSLVGSAFDRKRNLKYAMEIKVEESRLLARGCIIGGLVCKSMGWSRYR